MISLLHHAIIFYSGAGPLRYGRAWPQYGHYLTMRISRYFSSNSGSRQFLRKIPGTGRQWNPGFTGKVFKNSRIPEEFFPNLGIPPPRPGYRFSNWHLVCVLKPCFCFSSLQVLQLFSSRFLITKYCALRYRDFLLCRISATRFFKKIKMKERIF